MRVALKPALLSVAVLVVLLVAVTASNKAARGQEETPPQDEGRLVETLQGEGARVERHPETEEVGNVSPASASKDVTIDRTPPGAVANFAARPGDKRVDLSWTNPSDGDFASVRVLRSETGGGAPGPEGGCIQTGDLENPTECWSRIYEGTATSYGDVGTTRSPLINGKTYYYKAYARDKTGNWSPVVQTSATPAVPPPDTAAPTVSLTAPDDGATVSGASVALKADAIDDTSVFNVDFYVGSQKVGSDTTAGGTDGKEYSITWDSTTVSEATTSVTARAYDAAGKETISAARTVTVKNTTDTTKPTISLTSPANGATVSGTDVSLKAEAADDTGVADVRFYVFEDGWSWVGTDTTAGGTSGKEFSVSWDSTSVPDGGNYFYADVRDQAGNGTSANWRAFAVENAPPEDTTAPKVLPVETPTNKATGVKRNTPLTATFSEVMYRDTIDRSTFKLYKVTSTGTTQVTNVTVRLSSNGLKATLDPFGTSTTLLAKNTKYKAVVTTGAEDLAFNALDQNPIATGNQPKAWTFTTGAN